VKKRQDPWKGKHLLEIVRYEKHGGTKGKITQRPIWSVQYLDITKTTVFSYNFFLSKVKMLYKKIIERIQTRLDKYLIKKKILRQVARLARELDPNLPKVSSSSSDKDESL
jgi:hypothetical protein